MATRYQQSRSATASADSWAVFAFALLACLVLAWALAGVLGGQGGNGDIVGSKDRQIERMLFAPHSRVFQQ